jgi:hypothetical protein
MLSGLNYILPIYGDNFKLTMCMVKTGTGETLLMGSRLCVSHRTGPFREVEHLSPEDIVVQEHGEVPGASRLAFAGHRVQRNRSRFA